MNLVKLRIELLKVCEDVEQRKIVLDKCREDFEFFCNMFCWTNDPRLLREGKKPNVPFFLWEYQLPFVNWILDHIKRQVPGLIPKSRDMGATWIFCAIIVWKFLFDEGFISVLGSRKEDLVDRKSDLGSLIEKCRFILYRLPDWMLPVGYNKKLHDNHLRLVNPKDEGVIVGESANKDFGRGQRSSMVVMDEFAFWPFDEDSFQSVSQTSDCVFYLSTVNSAFDCFYRLWKNTNIDTFPLHYSLDPKKDKVWFDKKTAFMTKQQIARELEMDAAGSSGKAVYQEFNQSMVFDMIPGDRISRAWDFGRVHPACVFFSKNVDSGCDVYLSLMGSDITLFDFIPVVKYCSGSHLEPKQIEKIKKLCERKKIENVERIEDLVVLKGKEIVDYCDDAGSQKSDKSNQSSIDILNDAGIHPSYRWSSVNEGKLILDDLMVKGLFRVHSKARELIDGLKGGYHTNEKGDIIKDGYYEHPCDALREGAIFEFSFLSEVVETLHEDRYIRMLKQGYPKDFVDEVKKRNDSWETGYDEDEYRTATNNMGY